ncbi:MAG: hypothetical protein KGH65_02485 [Candidatus Micrarchaeota archaeon]|nr:hypothetical protein [Candidatus Micrarchaeota archaeon]
MLEKADNCDVPLPENNELTRLALSCCDIVVVCVVGGVDVEIDVVEVDVDEVDDDEVDDEEVVVDGIDVVVVEEVDVEEVVVDGIDVVVVEVVFSVVRGQSR